MEKKAGPSYINKDNYISKQIVNTGTQVCKELIHNDNIIGDNVCPINCKTYVVVNYYLFASWITKIKKIT